MEEGAGYGGEPADGHPGHDVARHYITYRYVQSLKRQTNTTDDRILCLIECNNEEVEQENANENPTVNSVQRDYMAGEVSKDLTTRLLLDPEIVKAHEEGIIHFHDSDYFAQHMHNCDLVNLEDMLQNGTVISGTYDREAPQLLHRLQHRHADHRAGGFQPVRRPEHQPDPSGPLCGRLPQEDPPLRSRAEMAGSGRRSAEQQDIEIVEKRLREEISRGVQTIQYQVVTLMTTNGQAPFITVFMYLGEARNRAGKADLAIIIEETAPQRYQGVKNEAGVWITPAFPKLIYVLEEDNIHRGIALLLPDRAGRQVHRQAHGAGLHLAKEDAGAQGGQDGEGLYTCMGCRSFLTPYGWTPRDRQAASTTAASIRALSPSIWWTWPCPPAAT